MPLIDAGRRHPSPRPLPWCVLPRATSRPRALSRSRREEVRASLPVAGWRRRDSPRNNQVVLVYQPIGIATLLHPRFLVSFPRISFPETINCDRRLQLCAKERCHYEDECRKALLLKRARHCGLTANGRSQANRGFSCVRNVNCCFSHCAAKTYNHSPHGELVRMPLQRVM